MRQNKTTIIFDQELKTIIREIKSVHSEVISTLGTVNSCLLANKSNANKTIRDVINTYIPRLNFIEPHTGKTLAKPDYFAMFMSIICECLDDVDTWDELIVKKDIKPVGGVSGEDGIRHKIDCSCCCGKEIKNLCLMVSSNNGCIVGNCCVEKHIISNPKVSERVRQQFKLVLSQQRQADKNVKLEEVKKLKAIKDKEELDRKLTEQEEYKKHNANLCSKCETKIGWDYSVCFKCRFNPSSNNICSCGKPCGTYKQCFNCFN